MTFYEAALEVLRRSGRPLHYKKITEIAIRDNLLSHVGKTPEVTMSARLNQEVKKEDANTLLRTRPGVFALGEAFAKKLNEEAERREQEAAAAQHAEVATSQPEPAPEPAPELSAKALSYPEDPELFSDDAEPSEGNGNGNGNGNKRRRRRGRRNRSRSDETTNDSGESAAVEAVAPAPVPAPVPAEPAAPAPRERGATRRGEPAPAPTPAPARQERRPREEAPRQDAAPRREEAPRQEAPRREEAPRQETAPRREESPRREEAPRREERRPERREQTKPVTAPMNLDGIAQAAYAVLQDAGAKPLPIKQIADEIFERKLVRFHTHDPSMTVQAAMVNDNQLRDQRGVRPLFVRHDISRWGLSDWGMSPAMIDRERALHAAADALRQDAVEHMGQALPGLSAEALEHIALTLLETMGYHQVKISKRSGDGDVFFSANWRQGLSDVRVCIQLSSTHTEPLQREAVTGLRGTLHHYAASEGIIIHFGEIAREAVQESREDRVAPITLIDRATFASLLVERGIGVRRYHAPVVVLDHTFFTALKG